MKFSLIHLKFALLTLLALSWIGCASSSQQANNSTEPDRVSNIPWNKPQSWEGGGALGGALGGAR